MALPKPPTPFLQQDPSFPPAPTAVAVSEIFAGEVKIAPFGATSATRVGGWSGEGGGAAASSAQRDHLRHRRHAGGVHYEEHVDAWDGGVHVCGHASRQLAVAGREAKREIALLHLD